MKKDFVLLVLIVSVLTTAFGCNHKNLNGNENSESVKYNIETDVIVTSITDIIGDNKERLDDLKNIINKPVHIEFLDDNNHLRSEEIEKFSDGSLNKPSVLKENEVFLGWKEDSIDNLISENIIEPTEKIHLTPSYIDITDKTNVIYNNAVYVSDFTDKIDIPVIVSGKTNFSIAELEIAYDKNIFEFLEFKYTDNDSLCNCVEDEGKIYISFTSLKNVDADVELCCITFMNKKNFKGEANLEYRIIDFSFWDEDKGVYKKAENEVINGKIVFW